MKNRLFACLLIFIGGLLSVPAAAWESEAPRVKLEHGVASIVEILFDDSDQATLEVKRDRIVSTLDEKLSVDYVIRRTLGKNWNKLSADQQREFIRLLTDLLLRTYTNALIHDNRPEISFDEPIELTAYTIEIPSSLRVRDKQVSMAYRMAKLKSGWEVYDIYIRGISVGQNYRSQFREYFRTKNAGFLIQILKEKLGKS